MMLSRRVGVIVVLTCGLTALGCGQVPGMSPKRLTQLKTAASPVIVSPNASPSPSARPTPRVTLVNEKNALAQSNRGPSPLPSPAASSPIAEGEQMLQQMRETLQKSEQFEVTLRTYSQGYFSGGNRTSELKKATSELKLIWARPMRLRVEILKTSNPVSEGAILTTEDMINCRLRAKGVLGLFPLTVAATDPKLANNRNHTLPATHPAATLTRITRPGATWTYLKEGSVEGTPVKIVEVSGVERLDHEVTREVIGVDTKTWTVRRLVQYVGDTKVGEHTMLDFQPAPVITPQTFQL